MKHLNKNTIESLIDIAKDAGNAINKIYRDDFEHKLKSDNSPITKADLLSNKIISCGLKNLTDDIPILSEEASDIPFDKRSRWHKYWLIDPLDGTKEFIKKNGEFTVNIALVVKNSPVFGLILVPTTSEIYWGSSSYGSFFSPTKGKHKKFKVKKDINGPIKVAISRSHSTGELDSIFQNNNDFESIHAGSSLKFCYVASGKSDCYLRLGPTSEWDTAAGEAILKYAGGSVIDLAGNPMKYNCKKEYLNPNFLASSNETIKKIILDLLQANYLESLER